MNENKVKNKNKAIIVVIIMLIILTLSTTIAFFTASGSGNTENIVSTDNIQLNYTDNKDLMKGELIPVSYEVAKSFFASEETCIYTDNNGNKFNACSIYEFSIENISDVAQELVISLNPTANSFTNLNYILYKVEGENNTEITTKGLTKNSLTSINLLNGENKTENITEESETMILGSGNTVTYKILFYILAKDYDQTNEDAGKSFGAGIRVDSITTGQYITKTFGRSCWSTELIENTENEYKLTSFSGINEDGTINESCTGYVEMDENNLYSVYIPSNVGGQDTTIIGNKLFLSLKGFDADTGAPIINNYNKIKRITISEGIKEIEDGVYDETIEGYLGAFTFLGMNEDLTVSHTLEVSFTDKGIDTNGGSLKTIGVGAFYLTTINSIIIPRSVESIGISAFELINPFSVLMFEGATDDTETGKSLLKHIGESAFDGFDGEDNPNITTLSIPASVTHIGDRAFNHFTNLSSVTFGTENSPSQLEYLSGFGASRLTSITIPLTVTEIGHCAFCSSNLTYGESNPLIIPEGVKTIGRDAFSDNGSLQSITLPSTVTSIVEQAFSQCNLTYGESNPLEIPSTVTSIGWYAFGRNPNLTHIRYLGSYSATDWYDSSITTIIKE